MSETLGLILVVGGAAALLVLRMPIGTVLLFAGAVGFSTIRGPFTTLETIGNRLFDIGSGYALSAVPLFLLMGHVASRGPRDQGR